MFQLYSSVEGSKKISNIIDENYTMMKEIKQMK